MARIALQLIGMMQDNEYMRLPLYFFNVSSIFHCQTERERYMKLIIKFLLPVFTIILFSSCIRMVYISKRIDPDIILNSEHHDIVFVNLFNYTRLENVNKKDRISYHAGVLGVLDGLSSFSNDSSFSFFLGDTLKKSIKAGLQTTLLIPDTINAICNRFNANLLLSLDSASIFFDRDTVINNYYGREYRSINFILNTRFFLSLYSEEGDLIDRSEVDQSSIFKPRTSMSGSIILVPSISRSATEIGNLAFQAGQDYVEKFKSHVFHDTKQLFSGKPFKESNDYIFSKNFNKAIELLDQLTKNQDPVIAEKARNNLEVAKEAAEANAR
jgi:hypothetical protein